MNAYDDIDYLIGTKLTEREKEISTLLCLAKSRTEIARELEISPNTVKNHLAKIKMRLGVYTSPEIVAYIINEELKSQFNITLADLLA